MMSFEIQCPHCNRKLKVPDKVRGRAVPCPVCKRSINIPQLAETTATPPPPPRRNADYHAKHFAPGTPVIFDAVAEGDQAFVRSLLAAEPNLVHAQHSGLGTPLHVAAEYGIGEMADLLLTAGADVDARNDDGNTPLHVVYLRGMFATSHAGSLPIAKALLNRGAAVGALNYRDQTPLHRVAELSIELTQDRGVLPQTVVHTLLTHGADPDARDDAGATPLFHACAVEVVPDNVKCRQAVIELLLNAGADVNAETFDRETPLFAAVQNARRDARADREMFAATLHVIEVLRRRGAYVIDVTTAAPLPDRELVAFLNDLQAGVDVTGGSPDGVAVPTAELLLADDQDRSAVRDLVRKLLVNAAFLVPYVILVMRMRTADKSGVEAFSLVVMLVWGLLHFKRALDAVLRATGFMVFATFGQWGWTFFIGAFIFGALGIFVIPVQMAIHAVQLVNRLVPRRLRLSRPAEVVCQFAIGILLLAGVAKFVNPSHRSSRDLATSGSAAPPPAVSTTATAQSWTSPRRATSIGPFSPAPRGSPASSIPAAASSVNAVRDFEEKKAEQDATRRKILSAVGPGAYYSGTARTEKQDFIRIALSITEQNERESLIRARIFNPDNPQSSRELIGELHYDGAVVHPIVLIPEDDEDERKTTRNKLIAFNCSLLEGVYEAQWGGEDALKLQLNEDGGLDGQLLKNRADLSSGRGLTVRLVRGEQPDPIPRALVGSTPSGTAARSVPSSAAASATGRPTSTAEAARPAAPSSPEGPFTGNWSADNGAVFRFTDDEKAVAIVLVDRKTTSGNDGPKEFTGRVARNSEKPDEKFFSGTCDVVFQNDPRRYSFRFRGAIVDRDHFRLICDDWPKFDKYGKRVAGAAQLNTILARSSSP